LREAKSKFWKDFCSGTQSSNPWNSAYRYAAGKIRGAITLSTLATDNNTHPDDIPSTLNHLMDYFIPEDSASSDGDHHKRARQLITEPMHTTDDVPFTQQDVQAAMEKFGSRKAPGEDALTSEILLQVFRCFPTFFTEVYDTEDTFHNIGRDQ